MAAGLSLPSVVALRETASPFPIVLRAPRRSATGESSQRRESRLPFHDVDEEGFRAALAEVDNAEVATMEEALTRLRGKRRDGANVARKAQKMHSPGVCRTDGILLF